MDYRPSFAPFCLVWLFVALPSGQGTQVPLNGSVSVVGCLQRNDNSGTLDSPLCQ
jgi:hypothetical protein